MNIKTYNKAIVIQIVFRNRHVDQMEQNTKLKDRPELFEGEKVFAMSKLTKD